MSAIVDCQSTLIANFGMPVWENPTEFMMEAVFKHEGMKYRYISREIPKDKLEVSFEGVKAMGFKGFNCTLPHKQNIIPLLDGLGESAELMGAVNCVVERDGKYIGENTDGKGYTESLKELTSIEGKTLLILGAGGAARAIAIECALEKAAKIIIVNRTGKTAKELAELVNKNTDSVGEAITLEGEVAIPANVDIVINATNIGLYPDTTKVPIDMSTLKSNMIVSDVIPNPPQTPFIQDAAARGCTTIDGLGMLVNQGKIAIKYWSDKDVNADVMREALVDLFS
ncbi:shikimate 5-dehydrogenase [Lentisphaera araneosa HTCC2155]|uniref:Shikimate dehydrogenase (NADP(+)) n=1 Tax=Lentisphaera araneosa HTCC2155 TaxID=313628 RepID=A6DJS2_9BACT|nr:shikimate dehydrogenase [Lentisphaera araneosa]EDM28146.1 shikimate 5-dehydrogenase [Lentisphaera araneosa HTCC2155]